MIIDNFIDNFMEYMRLGGAIMWIILAISILSMAIVMERILFFSCASGDSKAFEASFAHGAPEISRSATHKAMVGDSLRRLTYAAFECWRLDDEKFRVILDQQVRRELYRWEKNLHLLEMTAKVAPLLGLLGTVLGMVGMFGTMSLGGAIDAKAVTRGIWKALFTTVAGLSVAIPIIISHGVLAGRVSKEEEKLERGADFIIEVRFGTAGEAKRDAAS